MYVVWRQRPVTSDRKTELFVEYFDGPLQDMSGNIIKPGRFKIGSSPDVPAWKPLLCEHRGTGRVAWTPLLMHSERVGGKPRQKLLRRLPTIRTCCIEDRFIRAAWWHDINQWFRFAEENIGWNGLEGQFIARDKRTILEKLREMVPAPTAAGLRDFTAYRLEKEAEQKRLDEEYNAALRQKVQEDQRRREEEQARRQQEEIEKLRREWDRLFGAFAGKAPVPDCWTVLGLPPTATLTEVKGRYRELAMKHHPDRFGNPEAFKEASVAYEEACKVLSGRP